VARVPEPFEHGGQGIGPSRPGSPRAARAPDL